MTKRIFDSPARFQPFDSKKKPLKCEHCHVPIAKIAVNQVEGSWCTVALWCSTVCLEGWKKTRFTAEAYKNG